MCRVVFYCDSDVFGGHEKMAVAAHVAIRRYCDSLQIHWLVNQKNRRLTEALRSYGFDYAALVDVPPFSLRRNPLSAALKIFRNASILRKLAPDLILVVQGNISRSYDGILSASLSHLPYCSYIPMAYRSTDVKRYRWPFIPKIIWSLLYKSVSRYITIDPQQERQLLLEHPSAKIMVVENYVPKATPIPSTRNAPSIRIPFNRKVLTVIARIEFAHKCQDWLLQELRNDSFLDDKFVLFVGDGADGTQLQAMFTSELRDRFGMIGWVSDLSEIYSLTDVLLIPSRVEGVPLVMLEALTHRIPVVGSDSDGMKSWLPSQWRFKWGDTSELKRSVECALSGTSQEVWNNICKRLEEIHDENRFACQFSHALLQYCQRN